MGGVYKNKLTLYESFSITVVIVGRDVLIAPLPNGTMRLFGVMRTSRPTENPSKIRNYNCNISQGHPFHGWP